jgi:hypothetical protein
LLLALHALQHPVYRHARHAPNPLARRAMVRQLEVGEGVVEVEVANDRIGVLAGGNPVPLPLSHQPK